MKTIKSTQILLLGAIMLASCSTDKSETQPTDFPTKGIVFAATDATSGTAESRTVIDGTTVLWQAGDAIGIFSPQIPEAVNYRAEISADGVGKQEAPLQTDLQYNGTQEHIFNAYYPYSEGQSLNSIAGSIPVVQDGNIGKYALMYAGAKVENPSNDAVVDLNFRHVFSYLNIRLRATDAFIGAQVEEISIHADNASVEGHLTGDYTFDFGSPQFPTFSTTGNKLKMTSGITLSSDYQDNMFVVWHGDLTLATINIYVTLRTATGERIYLHGERAGKAINPGYKININLTADDADDMKMVENVPITFADPAVEEICLMTWDANDDGVFSTAEAADVGSIGTYFKGNEDITSFNELKYFTKLTSIASRAFEGCKFLKEIIIPEGVKTIESYAFYQCYALTDITLPDGLTTIRDSGLRGGGFTSITLPKSLTTIETSAFRGSQLTSITLPEGITSISKDLFRECAKLATVTIPASVQLIGNSAFQNCYLLKTVICMATTPPTIENEDTFKEVRGDLYVPNGSERSYDISDWRSHFTIHTME